MADLTLLGRRTRQSQTETAPINMTYLDTLLYLQRSQWLGVRDYVLSANCFISRLTYNHKINELVKSGHRHRHWLAATVPHWHRGVGGS